MNTQMPNTHLIYSFVTIIYWFLSLFSGYSGNLFKINILKLPTVFFDKNMIIKYESHSEIYARMRRRFRYMFSSISFHPSNGRVSVVCFRSHKYRVKLKKTINNSISHCLTAFSKIFGFWVYKILTEFTSSSIMLGRDMVAHMSQQPFAIQYPNSNSKDLFLYVALSRFLSFDRRENYIHRWIQNAMRGYSNFFVSCDVVCAKSVRLLFGVMWSYAMANKYLLFDFQWWSNALRREIVPQK